MNYNYLDKTVEGLLIDGERGVVTRVIDGDTVIIAPEGVPPKGGNESVRLLGINSPERGEKYYSEAKSFLEEIALNKTVNLEFGKDKYDRYKRKLAYLSIGNDKLNLRLIENGFANYYFPSGKDSKYKKFVNAWENCIAKDKNLCESSKDVCAECIELKEFNVKEQKIIFHNSCDFNCNLNNWEIKDEGRKNFIFLILS